MDMKQGIKALRSSYATLGFNLMNELNRGKKDIPNFFISPASIGIACSMLTAGAKTETLSAIREALLLQTVPNNVIHQFNGELLKSLTRLNPGIVLNIANSVWVNKGEGSVVDEFVSTLRELYKADIDAISASATGCKKINKWVDSKTNGKIDKVVDKLSADFVLMLINAIYFKGIWSRAFDKKFTKQEDFFLQDGSTKQVQLMFQEGKFRYFESRDVQAVELPYGDRSCSMIVMLPPKTARFAEWIRDLSLDSVVYWAESGLGEVSGNLRLPKFKIEYSVSLKESLSKMGMGLAFSSRADFSGIVSGNTAVSDIVHSSFCEVDEEKTEAAAVTVATLTRCALMRPANPFSMRVDRPFFFVIRDNQTGTFLFMGACVEP